MSVAWKILESPENQDRVTRLIDNFNKKILEDKSLNCDASHTRRDKFNIKIIDLS